MNPQQYTGKGDAFLDFKANAADFGSELNLDKVFSFAITNASDEAQVVLLNPSYAPSTAARVIKTGVIAYAGGATDLTAQGSPTTIEEFLAYVKANPTVVVKTQIKSNNADQLAKALIFSRKSPFKAPDSDRINLASFLSEFASNDKLVAVKREYQLDDQTELSLEIPPAVGAVATTTTITFYCGASLNTANALANKKAQAMLSSEVQNTKSSLAAR
jgi:hypothetical protein